MKTFDDLAAHARERALELRLDETLTSAITAMLEADPSGMQPWLLCYKAMERRLAGDFEQVLRLGQAAAASFAQQSDRDGQARATAEVGIAAYLLGRFNAGLDELAACPWPYESACTAALCLAGYLNRIGLGMLAEAVAIAEQGLHVLGDETEYLRQSAWRIVLQRNLAVAYHYQGRLHAALQIADESIWLAEQWRENVYLFHWTLYERGQLLHSAGRLQEALEVLTQVREQVEHTPYQEPLLGWICAALGHMLRDLGRLDEAAAAFQCCGWGEGDEGPLMLWLLQGKYTEVRCGAEAMLRSAQAANSPILRLDANVMLALLELEQRPTEGTRAALRAAAQQYATLGFMYSRFSVLFHLAAAEYVLGDQAAGDAALAEALHFGATSGYLNSEWRHPRRMQQLLQHAIAVGIEPEYSARLLCERHLNAAPQSLTIRCLGTFAVEIDGQPVPPERWRSHKAGAIRMQRMLLFLARHRAPQPLERIARYTWPDKYEEIDVSSNFHLTLNRLRRTLEPDLGEDSEARLVLTTSQGYCLAPELTVTVDLDQFLDRIREGQFAAAHGQPNAARAAFVHADQLYVGDFALARPNPFEADEYRRLHVAALRWLAEDDLQRGAFDDTVATARRLLDMDRWDEAAWLLLIRGLLAAGDRRMARQQYARYRRMFDQPAPAMKELAKANGW